MADCEAGPRRQGKAQRQRSAGHQQCLGPASNDVHVCVVLCSWASYLKTL